MKNILGILTRVSSKPQETDGTSLEVQKQLGEKCSKKLGLEPMIFNEGSQSSYNVEINQRPILVELLDKIQKKNGIRKLYVFNTDRLGRYSDSWFTILKVLFDYQVELFVGESLKPYDFSNPTDKLTMNILSSVSIYDNELRRLRSVMGKRNSLRSGNTFVGGTKPFGYDVKNKMLVINKEESEMVKKMFEMYKSGVSTIEIKRHLDTKTDFLPKRSKVGWNLGTIQKMLGNSLYNGTQKWEWKEKVGIETIVIETIDVKTPKIITNKLWEDVQKLLEQNQRNRDNRKKNSTIFDGLLYCKSCKRPLSIKSNQGGYELYSCPSVELKWKNPQVWDEKHKNCSLKKSVRVLSTDKELVNHLSQILKESKRVREDFKIKSLNTKFEEVKDLSKKRKTKERYLSEKIRYRGKLEDSIVDSELKILSSEISKSVGKKMKERVIKLIEEVNEQIDDIERDLRVLNNSSEWIDWLNQMYLEVDSLQDLSLKKQREFVRTYLKMIDVEYIPKSQSHKFSLKFMYPIVEDNIKIEGKDKKSGRRKYEVVDGSTISNHTIKLPSQRSLMSDDDKEVLNKKIVELRVEKSLSLNQVCDELNSLKITTPRKKKWEKSKLSSYIKNMKIDVGK